MFPVGVTHITALLAFIKEEGSITYFNGSLPVFSHTEEDTPSFRMITAQFCANGHTQCRAGAEISVIVVIKIQFQRGEAEGLVGRVAGLGVDIEKGTHFQALVRRSFLEVVDFFTQIL
jgi:hypothetical protein